MSRIFNMTDYKIRVINIFSSCCLKYEIWITVKVCFYFTIWIINAVDYIFNSISWMICYINIACRTRKSHCSFDSDLFLRIKFVCTCKTEDIRFIFYTIPIRVIVTNCIFNKWTFNKEIKTCNIVCTNCISMNIIYKVCKVHCHCIKWLDFVSYINITKFNQSTKWTAFYINSLVCICPNNFWIAIIIKNRFNSKVSCNASLNKNLSVYMNHKLIWVSLICCNIRNFWKFLNKNITTIHKVIWIISNSLNFYDFCI